jgi:hypothetical protein
VLYSVTVREHSVNRPRLGVEWRGLEPNRWVSEEWTALFLLAFSADHAFCRTFSTLPQNSWPFNMPRFSSTSVSGHCQIPQLSTVYSPRVVSPGNATPLARWQGLQRLRHDPIGNRAPSKEYITWPFMPRA